MKFIERAIICSALALYLCGTVKAALAQTSILYNPDTGAPIYETHQSQGTYHITDPLNKSVWFNVREGTGATAPLFYTDIYPSAPVTQSQPPEHLLGSGGILFDTETQLGITTFRAIDGRSIEKGGTGRFLSKDPLGYIDGLNSYQYSTSFDTNPLTSTDPLGLEPDMGFPEQYVDLSAAREHLSTIQVPSPSQVVGWGIYQAVDTVGGQGTMTGLPGSDTFYENGGTYAGYVSAGAATLATGGIAGGFFAAGETGAALGFLGLTSASVVGGEVVGYAADQVLPGSGTYISVIVPGPNLPVRFPVSRPDIGDITQLTPEVFDALQQSFPDQIAIRGSAGQMTLDAANLTGVIDNMNGNRTPISDMTPEQMFQHSQCWTENQVSATDDYGQALESFAFWDHGGVFIGDHKGTVALDGAMYLVVPVYEPNYLTNIENIGEGEVLARAWLVLGYQKVSKPNFLAEPTLIGNFIPINTWSPSLPDLRPNWMTKVMIFVLDSNFMQGTSEGNATPAALNGLYNPSIPQVTLTPIPH